MRIAIISDRADFRPRKVIRNEERYYIRVKELILPEDIIILNVYASDNRALKIHEAKMNRMARKNRKIHYFTWQH